MTAVALLAGSVIVTSPVALPAVNVSVACVALVTVCAVIDAPVPPVRVNVGVPGVPALQDVSVPTNEILLPVVLTVMYPLLEQKEVTNAD